MSLSLNSIKSNKGTSKSRKRIGRGNASGHGTYSGKGLKGQKARSGVSNLKRLGMKQVLLRTPKKRGFKSLRTKDQVINLAQINDFFKDGEEVNVKVLFEKKMIDTTKAGVKLLGNGKLAVSNLKIKGIKVSKSASEQVSKLKGKIS